MVLRRATASNSSC